MRRAGLAGGTSTGGRGGYRAVTPALLPVPPGVERRHNAPQRRDLLTSTGGRKLTGIGREGPADRANRPFVSGPKLSCRRPTPPVPRGRPVLLLAHEVRRRTDGISQPLRVESAIDSTSRDQIVHERKGLRGRFLLAPAPRPTSLGRVRPLGLTRHDFLRCHAETGRNECQDAP